MNVYIITTETFPNGLAATQRIRCYAKSITELGYKCKVLCLNRCEDTSCPLGNTETKGEIDGYSYRYLGSSTFLKKGWRNKVNQLLDTIRLVALIFERFHKRDKVIFYSYNTILRKIVVALAQLSGFEVYFEMNEHPSIQMSGFRMDDDNPNDRNRLKNALKGIDGFLCISSSLKDLLVRSGIDESKIHVVNMLVDASRFAGVEKQDVEPYVGYCGAADNNKDGVDQLIKAFGKIAHKYPDLKLYIMGPKREDCKNEELVKTLSLDGRVLFTGMISSSELPQKLMNARILALDRPQSRQAKYGFPTKLGEYLSTGNPVIVTSVGDIPLFLKDCESAYLVEPDNIEEFAAKLDYILSQNEDSRRVGLNGREVALKHFSGQCIKSQLKIAMNL